MLHPHPGRERERPLTEEDRRRISLENDGMAHAGLRVLALAGARRKPRRGKRPKRWSGT